MPSFETDIGEPTRRRFEVLSTFDKAHFAAYSPWISSVPQIWVHEAGAVRIASETPDRPQPRHPLLAGPDFVERVLRTIRKHSHFVHPSGFYVEPLNVPPGSYFPRIARVSRDNLSGFPEPFSRDEFAHVEAQASLQLSTLVGRLATVFESIYPHRNNLKCFGTETRNITILSSTEFEAQCKGMLRENGYPNKKTNISSYNKIENACRLSDYTLRLKQFPMLDDFRPFADWRPRSKQSTLRWYQKYNDIKHDRENDFGSATLEMAITATSSVLVVCLAQFGIEFLRNNRPADIMFSVVKRPLWTVGDSHGVDPTGVNLGSRIPYPFP